MQEGTVAYELEGPDIDVWRYRTILLLSRQMVEFRQCFSVAVHLPSSTFDQTIREKEKIYSGKAFPSMLSLQHILY